MSNNPLSEEQIKKINEIAKLPAEKQQKTFSEFLPTLTEEQVEFLKGQQGKSQCLFCSLIEGSIDSYKIYEDDKLLGVLDINPANPGHTILFPKKHFQFLGELDNELNGYMFNAANKISSKMVEKLKAEGVTIYVANGFGAGQIVPHISVHIIPRYNDDGIKIEFKGKKADNENLKRMDEELKINKVSEIVKEKVEEIKPKIAKVTNFFRRTP